MICLSRFPEVWWWNLRMLIQQLAVGRFFFVGWLIDLWIIYTMGHPKPYTFRGFLMVNNMVFRWPKKNCIFCHGFRVLIFNWINPKSYVVDGSEIPFPTTVWMVLKPYELLGYPVWMLIKPPLIMGETTTYLHQLVFSPDFWLPSTVCLVVFYRQSNDRFNVVLTSRVILGPHFISLVGSETNCLVTWIKWSSETAHHCWPVDLLSCQRCICVA